MLVRRKRSPLRRKLALQSLGLLLQLLSPYPKLLSCVSNSRVMHQFPAMSSDFADHNPPPRHCYDNEREGTSKAGDLGNLGNPTDKTGFLATNCSTKVLYLYTQRAGLASILRCPRQNVIEIRVTAAAFADALAQCTSWLDRNNCRGCAPRPRPDV
jgi:hypothetical protein